MGKERKRKSHCKKYDLITGLKHIQKYYVKQNKNKSFNLDVIISIIDNVKNINNDYEMERFINSIIPFYKLSSTSWMNLKHILNEVNIKDFNHEARVSAENILDRFPWERFHTKNDIIINKDNVRFDVPMKTVREAIVNDKNDIAQVVVTEREKFNNYIKEGLNDRGIVPVEMCKDIDRIIFMISDDISNPVELSCGRTCYMAFKSKNSKTGIMFSKIYISPSTNNIFPIIFYASMDKSSTKIIKYVCSTYYNKNEYGNRSYKLFNSDLKFSIPTKDPYELSLIQYLYSVIDKFNKKHNQTVRRSKNNDPDTSSSEFFIERDNKHGDSRIVKLDSYKTEYNQRVREYCNKGGTHASPVEHLRRGHYRHYKNGKSVYINPIIVNKGNGMTLYLDDPESEKLDKKR